MKPCYQGHVGAQFCAILNISVQSVELLIFSPFLTSCTRLLQNLGFIIGTRDKTSFWCALSRHHWFGFHCSSPFFLSFVVLLKSCHKSQSNMDRGINRGKLSWCHWLWDSLEWHIGLFWEKPIEKLYPSTQRRCICMSSVGLKLCRALLSLINCFDVGLVTGSSVLDESTVVWGRRMTRGHG